MVAPAIFTSVGPMRSTVAPISLIASNNTLISRTSGKFSMCTVSSVMIAAASIASAAFLAPPISTSPTNGFPPLIIYCSIYTPLVFPGITTCLNLCLPVCHRFYLFVIKPFLEFTSVYNTFSILFYGLSIIL